MILTIFLFTVGGLLTFGGFVGFLASYGTRWAYLELFALGLCWLGGAYLVFGS